MKIHHDILQGSQEWHELRAKNFTASELGEWVLEPLKITLTVDELKHELDRLGVPRKGAVKRDDLIGLLPNPENYLELCDGARTAIIKKITQGKRLMLSKRPIETLTLEEILWLDRQNDLKAKEEKSFEYNIPVQYGNQLEPYGRDYYEKKTGHKVTQVGFIECDGYGCSPDGLIEYMDGYSHGIEIKCPVPETHLAWLITDKLPDIHKLQVHASMAVTGLDMWDFLSYCPGDSPLLLMIERDDFTDQLESGLKILVSEMAKMKARLSDLWNAEFSNEQSPSVGATE
jgi:hypothetical protein